MEIYDSARWGLIPAGSHAALYYDGKYKVSDEQAKRFAAVRWITVLGGAAVAANAGAADWEAGNEVFSRTGALRDFVLARQAMGARARVYVNRSSLPAAHAQVGDLPNVVWWISTLDNKQWTAPELLADVAVTEKITLPVARLWAIQWKGGPFAFFDESLLTGTW